MVGEVAGASGKFVLRRHHPDLRVREVRECPHPQGAAVPFEIGGAENSLVTEMTSRHPTLAWLESDLRFGLRLGRELDETRISEAFTHDSTGIPFVKGRDVSRFGGLPDQLPRIDPHMRSMPRTIQYRRIAWRDVSRASQKRRVQACAIPAGYVTGNSLGIAQFSAPNSELHETLLAILNSLTFEIQVRAKLTTNHVSQGALRGCTVPYRCFEDDALRAQLANLASLDAEELPVQTEREIAVAKAYGLGREEFAALLDSFPKLTGEETAALLDKEAWS